MRKRRTKLIAAIAPLLLGVAADGATFTWNGSIDQSWSVAGNWINSVVPATGSQVLFSGPSSNTTVSQDMGTASSGVSMDFILFNDTRGAATSYTINGNPIQFDSTTNKTIRQDSAANQTINAAINNNSGTVTISGTGAGNLTLAQVKFF